ncbi:MAG TPA: aminotransferase class V-fold PLP-dependent enzyme [Gaiellaceae bacterium]|jgi:aromatic-L-amino-acid decarboxylase|nr:aminotransferase class V-fold PLP-dependent enzyme [Gaiellaceae bacterium]
MDEEAVSDFRRDGAAAVEWVADYLEGVRELRVFSRSRPGEIRAALPASPPETGEPFEDVLRDLDSVLLPGITHWNHPRFFGYFAISGSEPGILAELLVAGLNVNAMLWRTSPAATELEELALDWLRQLLGLPEGLHGHIEDTASTATIAALAAARELRPGGSVLTSAEANFVVERAARLLGLECRRIPVDGEFRLRPDVLAAEIDGATAVVATAGTTSTTSVDPVPEISELCERTGVWLHVDAAYGGAAAVCEEFRWVLEGCERADSVVVNPHKWLFTPIDCSCLWTRRPEAFVRAFGMEAAYMPERSAVTDLKDYGPALGRRFRALKLWAVLRCFGRQGLQQLIREHVRLAQLFASWVEQEPGWEIAAPHPLSTVCFRRTGSDGENEAVLQRVNASGEAFLTHTYLDGRFVLHLAVGNLRTTEDDVRRAWELLREAAAA